MFEEGDLVLEDDYASEFIGLPYTPTGIRNFRFAIRSLVEAGVIGELLETRNTGTPAEVEAAKFKAIMILVKFCTKGWHPYRVGRTLKMDHPKLSAVIMGYYLEIISNSPIKLRTVLIDILTGKKRQTFLRPEDLEELKRFMPRASQLRRVNSGTSDKKRR